MKLEREQPYRVMKDHGQFKKGDVVIVQYNDDTFAVVSPVMKGGRFAVPLEAVAPKVVITGAGQYVTRGGLLVDVYHKPGHARYCWAFKHDGEELIVAEDGSSRTPQAGDVVLDIVRPNGAPAAASPKSEPALGVVIDGPGKYLLRNLAIVEVKRWKDSLFHFVYAETDFLVSADGRRDSRKEDDIDVMCKYVEPKIVITAPGWYRTRDTRLVEVKPHKDGWFAVYDLNSVPYIVDKYGSAGTLDARFDIVAKAVKRPVITELGTYALRDGTYARIEVQQGDSFLVNAGPHGSYWVAADGRVNHRVESRYDVVSGPIANVVWFAPKVHVNVDRVWTLGARDKIRGEVVEVPAPIVDSVGWYELRNGDVAQVDRSWKSRNTGENFYYFTRKNKRCVARENGRVNRHMELPYDIVAKAEDPVKTALKSAKKKIHEHYRFNPEQAHHVSEILDNHFKDVIK